MSWRYGLLGIGVITLACSSGGDDGGAALPACAGVTNANVLAAPHSTYVYPNDKFGLSVQEGDGSIHVKGSVEDYSGVMVAFDPCVDLRQFAGISLRISGAAGTTEDLTLGMRTRDNTAAPDGTCKPSDAAHAYSDCLASTTSLSPTSGSYHFRWLDFSGGKPHGTGDRRQVTDWHIWFVKPASPHPTDVTIDQLALF